MNVAPDSLPPVVADLPLASSIQELLAGHVLLRPWSVLEAGVDPSIEGIYTFGHLPVTGEMMDRVPNLKVISNYGVGVDHISVPDAKVRGIPVGNTPGVLDGATADMAFGLLLATARRIVEGDRYARSQDFTTYDPCYMLGREVHGSTIGILGMGRIGSEIARRARGFSMQVLYHNRSPRKGMEVELDAQYVSFAELFRQSDHVVVSVPLNAGTQGLIGEAELAMMKTTATLVNIARGAVVDTAALTLALRDGHISAAGLDVTEPEPLPRDHPLLSLANVVIAPHLGSATLETRQKMAELSCANLIAGVRGKPLHCEVP